LAAEYFDDGLSLIVRLDTVIGRGEVAGHGIEIIRSKQVGLAGR
jgi:hypothetical protein